MSRKKAAIILALCLTLLAAAGVTLFGILPGIRFERDLAALKRRFDTDDPQERWLALREFQRYRWWSVARETALARLGDADADVRDLALELLQDFAQPADEAAVAGRLADPSPRVRYRAARLHRQLTGRADTGGGADPARTLGVQMESAWRGDGEAFRAVLAGRPRLQETAARLWRGYGAAFGTPSAARAVGAEEILGLVDRDLAELLQPLRESFGYGDASMSLHDAHFPEAVRWAERHIDAEAFSQLRSAKLGQQRRIAYFRKLRREYDRLGEWFVALQWADPSAR